MPTSQQNRLSSRLPHRLRFTGRAGFIAFAALALTCLPPGANAQPVDESSDTSASSAPSAPAEPPEVVIILSGGQRLTGLLLDSTRDELTVRIAGIDTRLAMNQIERYEVLPPIVERYNQLRRSIGDDPGDIVRLAQWLQAREKYELALTEVLRALQNDPDHGEARRLRTVLEQQILLKTKARAGGAAPAPAAPQPEAANPPTRRPDDFPLLPPDAINLIKVYEVDLADKPRLVIPRDVILRMLAANSDHPLVPVTQEGRDAILRRPATEILDLMFRLQAREFYREVQVLDQPRSMRQFRDTVQRTWLMSCATTACHGGLEAGRLVLHNKSPNSEQSVYTNFLILDRFITSRGEPLINWDNPEQSPLLHLGLPREDSRFPHPPAPRGAAGRDAWRPEFRDQDDPLFGKAVDWMRQMYRPRPEYPVLYTPLRPFIPPDPAQSPPAAEPVPR